MDLSILRVSDVHLALLFLPPLSDVQDVGNWGGRGSKHLAERKKTVVKASSSSSEVPNLEAVVQLSGENCRMITFYVLPDLA